VEPTEEGITTAAQALGDRISRSGDAVRDLVSGFLIDAIHNAATTRTLEQIHLDRAGFAEEVAESARAQSSALGLRLISASVVFADQSDVAQLDENNAFNAQGMRRLAEMVSEQRKARVEVETQTELAIRESRLQQHRRQLEIGQSEREAEITQREQLDKLEADAASRSERARAEATLATDTFRLDTEREAKARQVTNDEALRKTEMKAVLALEEEKIANSIKLAQRRAEEAAAKAEEEEARAQVILAAEHVQSQKDRAVTERENEVALLRQRREIELENARVKSDVDTLIAKTKAQASVTSTEAQAERARLEAEAAGLSAKYAAENTLSDAVMRMRLEERKLDRMPEIMTQMMKPVEKIDSIRINQIAGLGDRTSGGGSSGGEGVSGAFGAAMDEILGMAVRLPAMRKMGEDIGFEFDANLAGRTADYANRITPRKDDKRDGKRKDDDRKDDDK
ncbi:MAG: flotillin domain-containing protein, partial [Pseudomonadota bacterium]